MNLFALYIGIVTLIKGTTADLIGYNRQQNNVLSYVRNSAASTAGNEHSQIINLLNFYAQNDPQKAQLLLAKLKKVGKATKQVTRRNRFQRFHRS